MKPRYIRGVSKKRAVQTSTPDKAYHIYTKEELHILNWHVLKAVYEYRGLPRVILSGEDHQRSVMSVRILRQQAEGKQTFDEDTDDFDY